MQTINEYNFKQYSLFRVLFGVYLMIHFFQLLLVGTELFSNQGLIQHTNWNVSFPFSPNILYFFDSPLAIKAFLGTLVAASIAIIFNRYTQVACAICWYGFMCLFSRNNYIANPSLFYVGWILLAMVFIPAPKDRFKFPKIIFDGGWLIMGLSYTISGLHKATATSWQNGNALRFLIDNPLARDNCLNELLLSMPEVVLKLMSWSVLAIEIFALIGVLFKRTRFVTWFLLLSIHFGILVTINFADLTLGMILFHLFLFDPRWLKAKKQSDLIVFYDEECGVCNGFVQFILKNSTHIKFAPLQGEFAKQKLPIELTNDLDTIVILKSGKIETKADAILSILNETDGIAQLFRVFSLLPKRLRNTSYDIFAMRRHRFFKVNNCALLSTQERKRFIEV